MPAHVQKSTKILDRIERGEISIKLVQRINRSGKAIYIHATYNPTHDTEGNVVCVIEYCTDITIPTMKSAEAVTRIQASITFTPEGFIKDANETFLAATGYRLDEIQGQHHRIFCPPELQIHRNIKHSGRIWPRACRTQVNLNA